jgi:hypothetical protein
VEYFDEPSPQAIVDAVHRFEARAGDFDPAACRSNACRFSRERFHEELQTQVRRAWENFHAAQRSAS